MRDFFYYQYTHALCTRCSLEGAGGCTVVLRLAEHGAAVVDQGSPHPDGGRDHHRQRRKCERQHRKEGVDRHIPAGEKVIPLYRRPLMQAHDRSKRMQGSVQAHA